MNPIHIFPDDLFSPVFQSKCVAQSEKVLVKNSQKFTVPLPRDSCFRRGIGRRVVWSSIEWLRDLALKTSAFLDGTFFRKSVIIVTFGSVLKLEIIMTGNELQSPVCKGTGKLNSSFRSVSHPGSRVHI
jgi:hypothetical protein